MSTESTKYTMDDNIPMVDWGRDHWSTLAYMDTVMVECKGFQIGHDARMRSNRRNYRVLNDGCRKPKRPTSFQSGIVMDRRHGSFLADNDTFVPNHDDWSCIQDMAEEGLFLTSGDKATGDRYLALQDAVEPGIWLHLSEKGEAIVAQLRKHKSAGGSVKTFVPEVLDTTTTGR